MLIMSRNEIYKYERGALSTRLIHINEFSENIKSVRLSTNISSINLEFSNIGAL